MSDPEQGPTLVLASGSSARLSLLQSAGLAVRACPVDIDEAAIRDVARKNGTPADEIALQLAHAKAATLRVRIGKPNSGIIIAADQILSCEGRQIDKASDHSRLREVMLYLRGKTHVLHTAAVLYKDGKTLWSHVSKPRLHMRDFSEAFLNAYLKSEGDDTLSCVGGYRYEGRGIQLFDHVAGTYDEILGLPLLPLLDSLRQNNLVQT